MSTTDTSTDQPRRQRRRIAVRVSQVAVGGLIATAVWSVGFANGNTPAPVLPNTAEQFSLDLEVTATTDHPVVYAVEQRARPAYRIFAHDPATGVDTTVFTVPENAIVSGISLSTDRSRLAVTYSPDFDLGGSGLSVLDLDTGEMTTVVDVEAGVYHVDPVWNDDGTEVYTTMVDRRSDEEILGIGRLSIVDGNVDMLVEAAINPNLIGNDVYFLTVDESNARRSIARLDPDGLVDHVVGGDLDLDHLVAGTDTLLVAAIDSPDATTGLVFGGAVQAHGNHNLPSTWWEVPLTSSGDDELQAASIEPIIVYDAAAGNDTIVYATSEGLSIAATSNGSTRIDVISSRAIRFVAA